METVLIKNDGCPSVVYFSIFSDRQSFLKMLI